MNLSGEVWPNLRREQCTRRSPRQNRDGRNQRYPAQSLRWRRPLYYPVVSQPASPAKTDDLEQLCSLGITYSFAKTPLKAAHAPLATANTIQWFLWAQLIPSASAACAVCGLSRGCCSPGWDTNDGSLL